MTDIFAGYEEGLKRLLERLGDDHPRYGEALTLQARLLENVSQTRQYGDTEAMRAERAQIVDRLNQLALEALGTDFNRMSETAPGSIPNPGATYPVQHVDGRSGGVYFEGAGSVQIQGDVVGGDQTKSSHETSFQGLVTGPVHTGSGDIRVGSTRVSEAASLEALMPTLRQIVAEGIPETERSQATRQVTQMFRAISKGEPDLDLIESGLDWFKRRRPYLAGAIKSALLHPAVTRAVESADDLTAMEFRRRLGLVSGGEKHL